LTCRPSSRQVWYPATRVVSGLRKRLHPTWRTPEYDLVAGFRDSRRWCPSCPHCFSSLCSKGRTKFS
jgi:hypothetical protein